MANDTKERILDAALEMFSQNGYAGTNIRELSASLGLVKSGVYKHFESKEAIWNALLDQMFGRPKAFRIIGDHLIQQRVPNCFLALKMLIDPGLHKAERCAQFTNVCPCIAIL